MRFLGFINPFDELAEPDRRLGRKVANYGLVSALLEHGTAEELHFFLPFAGAAKPFQKIYAPWLARPEVFKRVKLLHGSALPAMMRKGGYLAFHAAELDRYFPELCHLRNALAPVPFPITCTTHTLSYWSTQVRNLYKLLPGPRAYDAVFCSSKAAREHLSLAFGACGKNLSALGLDQGGYAGRLEVAPLGVRAADFSRKNRGEARDKLGLEQDVFTLLCLGRLTPSDKFDLRPLLGVAALLAEKTPVRLVLAGADTGGYGGLLVKTASELGIGGRVHLFADFDTSLKADLFAAADVFVSPADNLQETFGLSILEAMAAGLPVVASDFSGYRDLVVEGETGFLIPTLGPADFGELDAAWPVMAEHIAALQAAQRTALDLDVMLERLSCLAASQKLCREMGEAGRRRVLDRFDWAAVVGRMEAVWEELFQIAAETGREQPPPNVLDAGLGGLFGHFFSGAVSPGDAFCPGPLSSLFEQGVWGRSPYPDMAVSLPAKGLSALMQSISRLGGRATLSQLQKDLENEINPRQVEHLALYGLKYGVLSRAS